MTHGRLQDKQWVRTLIERNDAKHFYRALLERHLSSGALTEDKSVLVVCGTAKDKAVFTELGFKDVTISNLDSRLPEGEFSPYSWSFQDAENLQFPDSHFDFVIVNAGLHHCHSPHRALLEMYRVAKSGILVIEARESLLMKLALKLGFAEEYEVCNVVNEGLEYGGVRNTIVPNYVYRWTEREVLKAIASYAPYVKPDVKFYYDLRFPFSTLLDRRPIYLLMALALYPLARLAGKLFPKQSNLFAFYIKKPELPRQLVPWLRLEGEGIALNMPWIRKRYSTQDKDDLNPG